MNDIFKNMQNVSKTDLHDPKWLSSQEDALRAHMKANPIRPRPPHITSTALILIATALATFFIMRGILGSNPAATPRPTITTIPSATPEPTATPEPSATAIPSPTQTIPPTHTPTLTPFPTNEPTPTPTPIPTQIQQPTPF